MSTADMKAKNPANNEFESIGKDSLTSTLRAIEIEHALSHDGKAFVCTNITSAVANGANADTLLINPTSNFPHLRLWDYETTGAPATIELWEGPFTVSNTGTACSLNVTNRTSSNTSSLGVYNTSSITLNNSLSTRLESHTLTGAKQEGGTQQGTAIEWVLKDNTNYLMRFNNASGGTVTAASFILILQPEDS